MERKKLAGTNGRPPAYADQEEPTALTTLTRRDAILAFAESALAQESPEPALAANLKAFAVPGAQMCLRQSAKPVWNFAAGLADQSSSRAVSVETRFQAASLSKPVFACAVLRLCEEGKLSLDAQLGDLLPSSDLPDESRFRSVTVSQILTHSSGIQPVPPKGSASRLNFSPGSRFAYSPHGFDFLQRAAERAFNQPLGSLVADTVLHPLKMTRSVFGWSASAETRAIGYEANGTVGQTINERVALMNAGQRAAMQAEYPLMNFPNAASSLITTANDYATFLQALARPAPAGLLSERFTKKLREPQIAAGKGIHWGLAFGLLRSQQRGLGLWHWGDFGVFQNVAIHFPELDWSLVILTNGAHGQRFNRAAAKALLSEELDCFKWLRV